MKLFRIAEVLVEDRYLSEVLRRMAGVVKQMEIPEPVVERSVRVQNGRVQPGDATSVVDLFAAALVQAKRSSIRAADVREFLVANGRNPSAISYLLRQGQDRGFLRKRGTGSGSSYDVTALAANRSAKKAAKKKRRLTPAERRAKDTTRQRRRRAEARAAQKGAE